jgi:hypothetical protein
VHLLSFGRPGMLNCSAVKLMPARHTLLLHGLWLFGCAASIQLVLRKDACTCLTDTAQVVLRTGCVLGVWRDKQVLCICKWLCSQCSSFCLYGTAAYGELCCSSVTYKCCHD